MAKAKLSPLELHKRKLIRRANRKAEKAKLKNSGWVKFEGDTLPEIAINTFKKNEHGMEYHLFRSGYGRWLLGATYYRGANPDIATEWIITIDDGGYYKVDAEYSLWYKLDSKPNYGMQCLWSSRALNKSIKSIMSQGTTVMDPDYQT